MVVFVGVYTATDRVCMLTGFHVARCWSETAPTFSFYTNIYAVTAIPWRHRKLVQNLANGLYKVAHTQKRFNCHWDHVRYHHIGPLPWGASTVTWHFFKVLAVIRPPGYWERLGRLLGFISQNLVRFRLRYTELWSNNWSNDWSIERRDF